MKRDELLKVASDAYFLQPEMVKFLLIENLALKTLLLEKGLMSLEDFNQFRTQATETLDAKTKHQIEEHAKQLLSR